MDFCHQTNDVIDIGAAGLPRSWRNVSGLDRGTPAELKALGWLPVAYVNEAFDPATQIRTGPTGVQVGDAVTADADSVVGTYTVRNKTPQELEDSKPTMSVEDLWEVLRNKTPPILTNADLPGDRRRPPRRP